jgi:hypothetical protein
MVTPTILMQTIYRDYADTDLANKLVVAMEELVRGAEGFHFFSDVADLTGYDSGYRIAMTQWLLRHKAQVLSIHLIVGSKLIAMGLSVVSMALGGTVKVRSYTAAQAFEAAMLAEGGALVRSRRAV